MRRKLSWPFVGLIVFSFTVGAVWGFKLIRDRKAEEGRLESEAKLRILAPPGIFSPDLLLEFQRREKIEVEVSIETFPASLLRRALKSAPGQYDAAIVFHYQVSALRAERKLASLYDNRVKFPISIAPDFRKLPNDRNLMDTAPLLWGLLGNATKKEFEKLKPQAAFWPSPLIGLEEANIQPNAFATKLLPMLGDLDGLEGRMKKGLGAFGEAPLGPLIVSHASLAFSPLKEAGMTFEPLQIGIMVHYPMWILTVAALSEGDLERTRKFVKFLLEPAQNIALVQTVRAGASTLRDQPELAVLPKNLQASFFRTFPIDQILLERDERIRSADEVLEQMVLGAGAKIAKSVEPVRPLPVNTPAVSMPPSAVPVSAAVVAPVVKRNKPPPPAPVETSGDEEGEIKEAGPPPVETAPTVQPEPTAPSEELPRDD